jgi:hypothetical protein
MKRKQWRQNEPRPGMYEMVDKYLARMRTLAERQDKFIVIKGATVSFVDKAWFQK